MASQLEMLAKAVISKVEATHLYFPTGGDVRQVQISLTTGERLRINEGQISFSNACCVRPGDKIEFEFGKVAYGSYKNRNDNDIKTTEFEHIGILTILEVGSFSDLPDQILIDAGRKPLDFTVKKLESKDQSVPPLPHKEAPVDGVGTGGTGTKENNAADESDPFKEDGH